jgi:hypothetical protein
MMALVCVSWQKGVGKGNNTSHVMRYQNENFLWILRLIQERFQREDKMKHEMESCILNCDYPRGTTSNNILLYIFT